MTTLNYRDSSEKIVGTYEITGEQERRYYKDGVRVKYIDLSTEDKNKVDLLTSSFSDEFVVKVDVENRVRFLEVTYGARESKSGLYIEEDIKNYKGL